MAMRAPSLTSKREVAEQVARRRAAFKPCRRSADLLDEPDELPEIADPPVARLGGGLLGGLHAPFVLMRHMHAPGAGPECGTTSERSELPAISACAAPSPWRAKIRA